MVDFDYDVTKMKAIRTLKDTVIGDSSCSGFVIEEMVQEGSMFYRISFFEDGHFKDDVYFMTSQES